VQDHTSCRCRICAGAEGCLPGCSCWWHHAARRTQSPGRQHRAVPTISRPAACHLRTHEDVRYVFTFEYICAQSYNFPHRSWNKQLGSTFVGDTSTYVTLSADAPLFFEPFMHGTNRAQIRQNAQSSDTMMSSPRRVTCCGPLGNVIEKTQPAARHAKICTVLGHMVLQPQYQRLRMNGQVNPEPDALSCLKGSVRKHCTQKDLKETAFQHLIVHATCM